MWSFFPAFRDYRSIYFKRFRDEYHTPHSAQVGPIALFRRLIIGESKRTRLEQCMKSTMACLLFGIDIIVLSRCA
jgi:hypothetical protein